MDMFYKLQASVVLVLAILSMWMLYLTLAAFGVVPDDWLLSSISELTRPGLPALATLTIMCFGGTCLLVKLTHWPWKNR